MVALVEEETKAGKGFPDMRSRWWLLPLGLHHPGPCVCLEQPEAVV